MLEKQIVDVIAPLADEVIALKKRIDSIPAPKDLNLDEVVAKVAALVPAPIVPRDGTDGAKGEDGAPGERGAKGQDGLGIKSVESDGKTVDFILDNDQVVSVELPRGEKGEVGGTGVGIDAPQWEPKIYRKGDRVQHHIGQMFLAKADTNGEPGDSEDWERQGAMGLRWTGGYKKDAAYLNGDVYVKDYCTWLVVNGEARMLAKRGDKGEKGEKGADADPAVVAKELEDSPNFREFLSKAADAIDGFEFVDGCFVCYKKTGEHVVVPLPKFLQEWERVIRAEDERPPIGQFLGDFDMEATYKRGDVVRYGNGIWVAFSGGKDANIRKHFILLFAAVGGGGGGGGITLPSASGPSILANDPTGVGMYWANGMIIMAVPDMPARDALPVAALQPGQMIYVQSTGDFFVWGAGPSVAGRPGLMGWQELLPRPTRSDILQALVVDPATPGLVTWEDFRDRTETVAAEADLSNRATMPLSHMKVGKLVYSRDTGTLWECLVDGDAGTATSTISDWRPLVDHVQVVARVGGLPDPTTANPPLQDGQQAMVRLDAFGNVAPTMWVFDATMGASGNWRRQSQSIYFKALRSDADHSGNPGDLQATLENGHKEIKQRDAANAWQTVYSEDQVKAWIAAGNSFQGTAQEAGHGTVGASNLSALPAETALGITDSGHYWTFVGTSGHVIGATEIGGAASNIAGARMNVGDWLQVANAGTAAAPRMQWTVIPGDLLAKARGDALYGLNNWSAGAYEGGTLVVYQGKMYRSTGAVLATDGAPGTAGAPWVAIDLLAGIKTVAADTARPTAPVNGELVLVLSSASASGKGAIYMWDQPSAHWQPLGGGGGIPLSLTGGQKIQNVGTPIGTIIMYASMTPPPGYLFCDGSTFPALTYPKLNALLGTNRTPDLRDQFIRGANTGLDAFAKHQDTTRMPRNAFTTSNDGNHTHNYTTKGNQAPYGSNHRTVWEYDATAQTSVAGAHTHTINGGDSETVPPHVYVAYFIKADDLGATLV
jgi:microcystin-dependent protein